MIHGMSRFALQFTQSDGHTEKLEVKERNLEVCNRKEEREKNL